VEEEKKALAFGGVVYTCRIFSCNWHGSHEKLGSLSRLCSMAMDRGGTARTIVWFNCFVKGSFKQGYERQASPSAEAGFVTDCPRPARDAFCSIRDLLWCCPTGPIGSIHSTSSGY
jgi:hypothetical protein